MVGDLNDTSEVSPETGRSEPTVSDAGRVAQMHHHARRGLAVSGMFAVAAVAATFAPTRTGVWLPLHLFFVGSVTTAISTVTLMLAVTWSASPAPPGRILAFQRWTLSLGAVLVVLGRDSSNELWTVLGGALVASSLIIVAILLLHVRRTARTPRFAPAIETYVLALLSALAGIALGIGLAAELLPADVRNAHVIVNLFAFIGVVIAATLPYFTATQARTKMASRATPTRLRAVSAALWASAAVAASAAALHIERLAALAIAAYGLSVIALATLLPRPRRKHLAWAGPRLSQLFVGVGWWVAMTMWIAAMYEAAGIDRAPLLALVIGGYGQILAASFAYLVPVVRGGGHQQLGAGFRRTRSWTALFLGNLAAVLALLGHDRLMTVTLCAWAIDAVARTAVHRRRQT